MTDNDPLWSAIIPSELLEGILEKLTSAADQIRFGAVCNLWRSALLEAQSCLNPFPLVLLPPPGVSVEDFPTDRELLDLDISTNKSRSYKLPPLFEPRDQQFIVGSSYGWLATIMCSASNSYKMQLFNPITRAHIPLPPATTFPGFHRIIEGEEDEFNNDFGYPVYMFNDKVLLFTDPKPHSVVMAIHGLRGHLCFCKLGDGRWTVFPDKYKKYNYHDVVYHNGRCQFYAVTDKLVVLACDLDPVAKVTVFARHARPRIGERKYLVESSSDELLILSKYAKGDELNTTHFDMDKLDLKTGEWEEVTTLDGGVMFLGNCRSVLLAAEKAQAQGCNPNTIYFLDDKWHWFCYTLGCNEFGAYNCETKQIHVLHSPSQPYQSPMFWITQAW